MSKKIILATIGPLLLVGLIYQSFFRQKAPPLTVIEVSRGNIFQEVSETGRIKKGEEINLSFKNASEIEKIYAVVGEEVKKGDILAKSETSQLQIQLQEAKSALGLAQAKLNKLLAGASPEEIQITETSVNNAEISLESAKQNLKDTAALAERNLNSAYEDALNILDDSYLKIYNVFNVVDSIQRSYFTANDQESLKIRENKDKIEKVILSSKSYLDTAKADLKNENIDTALSEMKKALTETSDALKIVRETCETVVYLNRVSSTDKTSLDTHRGYINTALTNVTNLQQTIISTKLTNTADINTAQAKVDTAQGQLKAAEDELAQITAAPRQEDIDLNEAQVNQAKAQLNLLENQIEESFLRSPTEGQITKINKKVGEMVQPMLHDVVITILPVAPFEIEVDIYEEDVVKMNVGNPVDIALISLPNQIFEGRVIFIDPAQKLIEGVVYYEVTIDFEKILDGVKPGMTADVIIKTASKENVIVIPEDTIQKKDSKTIVQVLKNRTIDEREIEIGLQGSNNMVEVISGLKEGEKIILK